MSETIDEYIANQRAEQRRLELEHVANVARIRIVGRLMELMIVGVVVLLILSPMLVIMWG